MAAWKHHQTELRYGYRCRNGILTKTYTSTRTQTSCLASPLSNRALRGRGLSACGAEIYKIYVSLGRVGVKGRTAVLLNPFWEESCILIERETLDVILMRIWPYIHLRRPVDKSALYPSRTSLVAIHRLRRMRDLVGPCGKSEAGTWYPVHVTVGTYP